jgi:hypothetical protein
LANLVENGMIHRLRVRPADSEADLAHDLVHDLGHVHVLGHEVGEGRLVAAGDVVADAAGGDVLGVGDRSPDGLGIAQVVVGTKHGPVGDLGAALDLAERALVHRSKGFQLHLWRIGGCN